LNDNDNDIDNSSFDSMFYDSTAISDNKILANLIMEIKENEIHSNNKVYNGSCQRSTNNTVPISILNQCNPINDDNVSLLSFSDLDSVSSNFTEDYTTLQLKRVFNSDLGYYICTWLSCSSDGNNNYKYNPNASIDSLNIDKELKSDFCKKNRVSQKQSLCNSGCIFHNNHHDLTFPYL